MNGYLEQTPEFVLNVNLLIGMFLEEKANKFYFA